MSSGVGCRHDLLLWLWCRPVATALIGPSSLGMSICRGYGPTKTKKKKKKKFFVNSMEPMVIITGAEPMKEGRDTRNAEEVKQ